MRPIQMLTRAVLILALAACGPASESGSGSTGGTTGNSLAADQTQYDQLQTQLDGARTQALDRSATELVASSSALYWLDFNTFDPKLHRLLHATGARVDYGFSIGTGDTYNFRASDSLVVTAEAGDGVVHVYDATQPNAPIASTTLPKPTNGVQWWAYAVDGDTVYFAITDDAGAHALFRWQPKQGGDPESFTTLESAGASIGEFYDFSVSGNDLVFVESGRLWRMDLASNAATWIHTDTQVGDTVDFDAQGATFTVQTRSGEDLSAYSVATGVVRNLTQEIAASSYRINATFTLSHLWADRGFGRWGSWVVYAADGGVFAYDVDTRSVVPVLLEPRGGDLTLTYTRPVVLADGTMYVTGLTSTDGATGADGPVYAVSLASVLK